MTAKRWLPFAIVALLLAAIFLFLKNERKYPFASLRAEDIVSVEASGRPKYPGAYMLTEEEISFLAEMLHEIGVLKEVDYTEYSCWQSCMFEITMKGGEHTVFSSNGGMVIIDEVGYITDKDSWHAEFEIGIFYESCVEKIGAAMGLAS